MENTVFRRTLTEFKHRRVRSERNMYLFVQQNKDKFREVRKAFGATVEMVAALANTTSASVYALEQGWVRCRARRLYRLLRVYELMERDTDADRGSVELRDPDREEAHT